MSFFPFIPGGFRIKLVFFYKKNIFGKKIQKNPTENMKSTEKEKKERNMCFFIILFYFGS